MYLDAITELAKWFNAMDHTNYTRWIPFHLRDITDLLNTHPAIAEESNAGKFTVQKTRNVFQFKTID